MKRYTAIALMLLLCALLTACGTPEADVLQGPETPAQPSQPAEPSPAPATPSQTDPEPVTPSQPEPEPVKPAEPVTPDAPSAPTPPPEETPEPVRQIYDQAMTFLAEKNCAAAQHQLSKIPFYKDAQEYLDKFVWHYTRCEETTGDQVTVNIYSYGEAGRLTRSGTAESYYDYTYKLDDGGVVLSMTRTSNVGQTIQTFYNYDTEGRVTRETTDYNDVYRQIVHMEYNDLGQLIRKEIPDAEQSTRYEYDDRGNLTLESANYYGYIYENQYDDQGRLISRTQTTEAQGLVTRFQYAYNEDGRLIHETITEHDGTVTTKEYSGYVCFYQP